ncbi:hypothetical protein Nisw_08905 [Candidatus Nitrosopumilus sp. SW]|uniref:hypothetical protein n=1 Tax=Candidatus Nitrosopumilus sp. SW TaxID=2508726 RepID=UPI001151C808|nr:hypothetical protein [Candidatus Nitrosopumilus sp. SW]QDI89632.1 hypothetical protein Nisw_08905 [Candidatus Nitrosopumilus sp. SW]
MDYEELEPKIKKIVEIVESIPESYRTTCFEMLLESELSSNKSKTEEKIIEKNEIPTQENQFDFQVPIEVRAFFRQFSLDEGKIYEQFIISGKDEIAPTYKISTTVTSKAQIQIALMTALENTLKTNGSFEFSMEDVRKRCDENKCLNRKNFMNNFNNNKKLFKDLDDEEHVKLSPYGKEKLSETINEL